MTELAPPSPQGSEEVLRQLAEKIRQMQERLDYFERGEFVSAPGQTFSLIERQVLAVAGQFSFTSIPQTYQNLLLVGSLRSSVVATSDTVVLRFNGDAGANYDWHQVTITGAGAVAGANALATTSIAYGNCNGTTAPADRFSPTQVLIPGYGGAFHKGIMADVWIDRALVAADLLRQMSGGRWRSTAAITTIVCLPAAAPQTFEIGSEMSLYGLG